MTPQLDSVTAAAHADLQTAARDDDDFFSYPLVSGMKVYDTDKLFPLLFSPPCSPSSPSSAALRDNPSAVLAHLSAHREHIFSLLRTHGVLLFRGFASESSTAADFARFVTDGFGLTPFPYALGNAVRRNIVKDIVFTANEAPADRVIPFHHELAQTPLWPRYVLFFCDVPATTEGQTPVAHSRAVYNRLPRVFTDTLERHGVVYRRRMTKYDRPESAIGRGWASTFGATTRKEAEEKLKMKGYGWEWGETEKERDVLTEISPVVPAVMVIDEKDREKGKAFFNQLYAAWTGWRDEYNNPQQCVRLGNGHPLDEEGMEVLQKVLQEEEVALPWERGDFMLIDNVQAMHSRKTFTGKRVVLASLAK